MLSTLLKETSTQSFFPVNVVGFSNGLAKPIQHFIQQKCHVGLQFEKWSAIRASVGGVGGVSGVLSWVAC